MPAYDPKRPRPSAATPADDPAPVEALLDPTSLGDAAPVAAQESSTDRSERRIGEDPASAPEPVGVALNGASASQRTASEVPVAPAPATGTANRAVLIAAAVSSIVGFLALVVLARRRRR